jgi:hypothetical protein
MAEQRKHPRFRSLNFVSIEGAVFRTLDVSREGLMIEMEKPPVIGQRLTLHVAFGEALVKMPVEVMRHETRGKRWTGVGCRFENLTPRARMAIEEHIIAMKMAGKA